MAATTYAVRGMTCDHCVRAVTQALGGLAGVSDVAIDLEAGRVTVVSDAALEQQEVARAVADAGYELATD